MNFLINENDLHRGEKLIDGVICIQGYPEVKIHHFSWVYDFGQDRDFIFVLQCFEFISWLIAYEETYKNLKGINKISELCSLWLNEFRGTAPSVLSKKYNLTSTKITYVWHDHATAKRAYNVQNFCLYIDNNKNNIISCELYDELCELVQISSDFLAEESFYSRHTNHGLIQDETLLFLSLYIKNNADLYRKLALARINEELDFQFTTEGIHKENSPGYHVYVFNIIVKIFSKYNKFFVDRKFVDFYKKCLYYIVNILRPDGKVPILGDTFLSSVSDYYNNMFSNPNEYQMFKYVTTKGTCGISPYNTSVIYPKSGYAIFRDSWKHDSYTDMFQLICKAGCLSTWHSHADEGHILLYALGEDWLIDSGHLNYIEESDERKYMRSRQAHNVIMLNDTYKDRHERLFSWNTLSFFLDDKNICGNITMFNGAYRHYSCIRTIRYFGNLSFQIEDVIIPFDTIERNCSVLFHVPSDKDIYINKDNSEIIISKNNKSMKIDVDTINKISSIQVFSGIIDKKIYSITSESRNVYSDSYVIQINFTVQKLSTVVCKCLITQTT